jgi:hypothetical protein
MTSADFAINTAWMTTAFIAHDLLCWSRLLVLAGDLARAEPKRLRYCLLHTVGLIARTAPRVHLRLAAHWPWAHDLVAAFTRVNNLRLRI